MRPPLLPVFLFLIFLSGLLLAGLLMPVSCAALSVTGFPGWLEPAVVRSLEAVWDEIPDAPDIDREGTLALVASRLFTGYDVRVSPARAGQDGPEIFFKPLEPESPEGRQGHRWSVRLIFPELREMTVSWFRSDIEGLEDEILELVRPLPQAALTWADNALRETLAQIVNRRLPGWDFSVQAALGGSESGGELTVAFRPGPPLVLAINPSLYSRTIPAMFGSDLRAKLISGLSPLIGLPVDWVNRHRSDVEAEARLFLEDRNTVGNMRARVSVTFVPGPVAGLDARVESERFLFQVWIAGYIGLEGRYPEGGVFFGWNTRHLTGVDFELYAEVIADLDDFGVAGRLGGRAQLLDNFWAGMEMEWPGDNWFIRAQWGPSRMKRPYMWWRWNPDLGHEGALGYRVDEHISVEIYYDGTGSDRVGLRGLWLF